MTGDELTAINSRLDALESRMVALERAHDDLPRMLEAAISSCLDAQFPALWAKADAAKIEREAKQRKEDREELVKDIRKTLLIPFRGAQYLGPILQVIIAATILWAALTGVFS